MSTLGDLLAEHTVLPGTAVDHLHAVVGEWQMLADLSFADYLMWVRRDDEYLVCVAQVRPNTASTMLLADAVGTTTAAAEMPVVRAAFDSGAIGREILPGRAGLDQADGGRLATGRPDARHSGKPNSSRRADRPAVRRWATASIDMMHSTPRQ